MYIDYFTPTQIQKIRDLPYNKLLRVCLNTYVLYIVLLQ